MDALAESLTAIIKTKALEHGFSAVGVCPAVPPAGLSHLHNWLEAGYAGQMHYLEDRRDAYDHPQHVLAGVRGIVMLAVNYKHESTTNTQAGQGRVSRYAFGQLDYHDWIHDRLRRLKADVLQACPSAQVRGVVDTAPLLEREFARQAGLGWFGKNTMLLNKRLGSLFFLAALLTDQELIYDEPHTASHCGTCTACLDACPTDAFVGPFELDARRCISYLTIELRDEVPVELRPGLEDWVFGCDVCQDVCPWNRKSPTSQHPEFAPLDDRRPLALRELFFLDDVQFRQRFRHTPLWRPRRRGILRNAALVLGNQPTVDNLPALEAGLRDPEWIVRGASAWALGNHPFKDAADILKRRQPLETEPAVVQEIDEAINRLPRS